jgi:hypothetical protein
MHTRPETHQIIETSCVFMKAQRKPGHRSGLLGKRSLSQFHFRADIRPVVNGPAERHVELKRQIFG